MAKRLKARVEIYSWIRGNNSNVGNPSLVSICGKFLYDEDDYWLAKSASNTSWVYGVSSCKSSAEPPLLCDITYHYTPKGNMIIDNLKEVKYGSSRA